MCLMGGITYLFIWVLAGKLLVERCVFRAKDISTPAKCMGVWVCDGVCLCEVRELMYMGTVGLFVIIYVWAVVGCLWFVQCPCFRTHGRSWLDNLRVLDRHAEFKTLIFIWLRKIRLQRGPDSLKIKQIKDAKVSDGPIQFSRWKTKHHFQLEFRNKNTNGNVKIMEVDVWCRDTHRKLLIAGVTKHLSVILQL